MKLVSVVSVALLAVPVIAVAQETGRSRIPTKVLQTELDRLGFQPGPIDGIHGPRTHRALVSFQQAMQLSPGMVDPATIAKLGEIIAYLDSGHDAEGTPVLERTPAVELTDDQAPVDDLADAAATAGNTKIRIACIEVLGDLRSARSRGALSQALVQNDEAEVRTAAAKQLGRIGDEQSLYALALAIENEPDPAVRDAIQTQLDKTLPVEPGPQDVVDAVAAK
jgi:hypothetical protein